MTTKTIAAFFVCAVVAGSAQAALHDRGGGLIYDDIQNITWLQDANYAKSSGFDGGGVLGWAVANNWVAHLSYYDSVRDVTYTDWRLPSTLQPDATCGSQFDGSHGYSCTGSELGHLFYIDLGGVAGQDITHTHNANYSLFSTIQGAYWSELRPGGTLAWSFTMGSGYQGTQSTTSANYLSVWAVRDGDVAAVPEPETYAMMLAGLILIGLVKRHNCNNHKS